MKKTNKKNKGNNKNKGFLPNIVAKAKDVLSSVFRKNNNGEKQTSGRSKNKKQINKSKGRGKNGDEQTLSLTLILLTRDAVPDIKSFIEGLKKGNVVIVGKMLNRNPEIYKNTAFPTNGTIDDYEPLSTFLKKLKKRPPK